MIDQTILIIDDDADLLQIASLIFKETGSKVVTAHDDLGGLTKFFTHHPNLITLDVKISGPRGRDLEICHPQLLI
jgi:DNA-binding response OmpR family regulator